MRKKQIALASKNGLFNWKLSAVPFYRGSITQNVELTYTSTRYCFESHLRLESIFHVGLSVSVTLKAIAPGEDNACVYRVSRRY